MPERTLFAVDIGTRSVVGLVGRYLVDSFHVDATAVQEHSTRSMLDGQIHDIEDVAAVIRKVKSQLEAKAGPLKQVSVAAAGRALRTVRSQLIRETLGERLTKDDVLSMELEAVSLAQSKLAEQEDDASRYHCVGYTVLHYKLDESRIGSLVGQSGMQASVEIIATFLPKVVVDSLQFALDRCDLQIEALTLEPIAAIHALIPSSMRKLNLTLIDIGAGTSDIAITSDGTVTAYGMVPVAGDEITEAISSKFILDFKVAEQIKRELSKKKRVSFKDVLGMTHKKSSQEILEEIKPEVTHLAKMLTAEILQLNGSVPQAVMLIGGGSQTPQLREILAFELGLSIERVVIRGVDAIQSLTDEQNLLKGPEFVTPVGIALSAVINPVTSVAVTVNETTHHLFEFRPVTVADALLSAKIDYRKLYGRPGDALTVHVDGQIRVIRGGFGTSPVLTKNGMDCHLDDLLQHLDVIEVKPGIPGKHAAAAVGEVVDSNRLRAVVYVNEQPFELPASVRMNQKKVSLDEPLVDRAVIEYHFSMTLQDVLVKLNRPLLEPEVIELKLNGSYKLYEGTSVQATLNGAPASPDTLVEEGSWIELLEQPGEIPTLRQLIQKELMVDLDKPDELQITVNGDPVILQGSSPIVTVNGESVGEWDVRVKEGDEINVSENKVSFTVAEMLHQLQVIARRPSSATHLIVEMNGAPAELTESLHAGCSLRVEWGSSQQATVS